MRADTVDLLTTKGRFPAEQALAVAEAIDMAIRDAQLVTVPILDSRFAVFEARFAAFEARWEARLQALEAKLEARLEALEAKWEARLQALEANWEARFKEFEARIDQKFDRLRLQLIIAIILGYAAMGPLGTAAFDALRHMF